MRFAIVFLLLLGTSCGKSIPTQSPVTLLQGPFTIYDNSYIKASFTVDNSARLKANIRVTEGGSLDVETYVISDFELTNFENGTDFRSHYNSGRVTVASLDMALSSGRYHLIISNKFSLVFDKIVTITATLE